MQVGLLEIGDSFYHKNVTYKVLDIDYVFVKAEKQVKDGFTHYFLNDIEIEKANFCSDWKWENPNHVINDRFKK
jgi:hypothetical protein